MDETALLAMGILLEEAAKEILGESGDLVFVEGDEVDSSEDYEIDRQDVRAKGENKSKRSIESRRRKRRKLDNTTDEVA